MELRQLRYFVVAAEEENFHRAAKRLHIVQPALSRQMKALQDETGIVLFERVGQKVRLSARGREFLDRARRVLKESDELAAWARQAQLTEAGVLTVGFSQIAARAKTAPKCINAYREQYPNVELKLAITSSQQCLSELRDGRLDAAFMFGRPVGDASLDHTLVSQHNRALVLNRSHPLAKARRIRLADLTDEPFILLARAGQVSLLDDLLAACASGGLSPRIVQEAKDESTLLHLVSTGMGLSFLLSPVLDGLPSGVVTRTVEDLSVPVDLELVWKKTNESDHLRRFVDLVRLVKESDKRITKRKANPAKLAGRNSA